MLFLKDRKSRHKFLVGLGISLVSALLIWTAAGTRPYRLLELKALDLRFVLMGGRPAAAPVVHIDIDDQSLSRLGRWPWPRRFHAQLTDLLKECGARTVLWDVIFSEEFKDSPREDELFASSIAASKFTYLPFYFVEETPLSFSPELRGLLLKDISITAEAAAKQLNASPDSLREPMNQARKFLMDEAVRELIRDENDITLDGVFERLEEKYGWFLFSEDESYVETLFAHHDLARSFMRKFSVDLDAAGWPYRKQYRNLSVPIRAYTFGLAGSGFINAEPDLDGVTRSVPLLIRYGNKVLPQLTVACLMDLLDAGIEAAPGSVILKQALFADGGRRDIRIPVDDKGCMLVNWQGRWGESFKHVPYYLILELSRLRAQLSEVSDTAGRDYLEKGEAELMARLSGMVKDKICLVGLTATGTHDLRPVPMQEKYPMVGTHSNLINTILSGKFIVRREGALRIFIFLLTALVIAFGSMLKLWKNLLVSLGFAAAYFLACVALFGKCGLWIDMVGPMGIVVLGFSSITSFRFFTEEKEKLWIKGAFSHYLSKEVIGELLDDPSRLKLGGERRMITVFFSDVRGFTSFSESHQPEEVVAMLNEILTAQVKVVFKYDGTLDKFVGDELMAFYGAPGNRHLKDHALVAVRTALEIQEKMRHLRDKWKTEGKDALNIGIGINSGEMVVGNMGSAERMDYTVIGDNVNLGARLCSAAGRDEIIISEQTYRLTGDTLVCEKLEPISVKGKSRPISIYRVTGLKEAKPGSGGQGDRPA